MKRKRLSDEENRALRFIKAMGGLPEVMRGFQRGMTYESDLAEILYGNPYAKVDERQAIHDVYERLEEEEKHSKFLNGWGGFDGFVRFFEEVLGRYAEDAKTLDELLDAIDQATLPQGCTWPKDRNGKSIKPNYPVYINGEKMRIVAISHKDKLCIRPWEKVNGDGGFWVKSSEVSLAPCSQDASADKKVLDANGVEIRVGNVLYSIETGDSVTVGSIEPGNPWFATTDGTLQHCAKLTHRAPVLAADGKPLREGETVWGTGREEHEYVILGQPGLGGGAGRFKVSCHDVTDDVDCDCDPDLLTHERPVADTWERLEEDAGKEACEYFAHMPCGCETSEMLDETVEKCNAAKARDLVRRAKKLAGVQ